MTPLQLYQSDLEQKKIVADDVQMLVVQKLQQLYLELNEKEKNKNGFLSSLFTGKQKLIHGLYLWPPLITYFIAPLFDINVLQCYLFY